MFPLNVGLMPDRLPRASTALTLYWYRLDATRPLSSKAVALTGPGKGWLFR